MKLNQSDATSLARYKANKNLVSNILNILTSTFPIDNVNKNFFK